MSSKSKPLTAEGLFEQLATTAIRTPEGGYCRPSYSAQETAALQVIGGAAARTLGLEPWFDAAGNLHILRPGQGPEIVTGSHLDTVPNGGPFDGAAGVVAGLLALQNIMNHWTGGPPIRLIALRGEESAWFGKCYLGSLGLFGKWTKETLDLVSRHDGKALSTTMTHLPDAGWYPCTRGNLILPNAQMGAFVEVHIEQGPVLHDAGEPLGIVTGIRGNCRYPDCVIRGKSGHSGTTPMKGRADAVMAFSELMTMLELGAQSYGETFVLTCGIAGTVPEQSAMTIIPATFRFALEFRSDIRSQLDSFIRFVSETVRVVQERRGVTIDLGSQLYTDPVALDPRVTQVLAQNSPVRLRRMPSGAGHDAAVFEQHGVPSGMIFIRNEHGSHNPQESMRLDDLGLAVELLTRTFEDPQLLYR